jgi:SMI1/KNR4 family protein SUKH-1
MDATQLDELIRRLRARAADPERRTDSRPSRFEARVQQMDLGQLVAALQVTTADLHAVVGDIRSGRLDPARHATAGQLRADMTEPVTAELPPPAAAAALAAAQALLGSGLPPVLQRVYSEVADGGFGPGGGLLPIATAAQACLDFRRESPGPRRSTWPAQLLPVVAHDPGCICVDLASGAVVDWDPDGLGEWSRGRAWQRSFSEIAPSVEDWLWTWVGSRTQAERMADLMRSARRQALEATRAHWAARTPEERARFGLGDDWEQTLFGHLEQ